MIELDRATRVFEVGDQEVRALDDLTLQIDAGDYVSIMGPSGSGKSTLLHILGLLDRLTSGRLFLDGVETTTLDDEGRCRVRRDKIGFVFQFFHLVPRLNAAANLELPLMLAGVAPTDRHVRVEKLLDQLGLTDRAHHRPDQLSGGQRQRVAIGRAMIMRPAVILADEPTGNLDRASGQDIVQLLEALNDQGVAVIVVTHDPDLGARARRRLQMVDGRLVGDESR